MLRISADHHVSGRDNMACVRTDDAPGSYESAAHVVHAHISDICDTHTTAEK